MIAEAINAFRDIVRSEKHKPEIVEVVGTSYVAEGGELVLPPEPRRYRRQSVQVDTLDGFAAGVLAIPNDPGSIVTVDGDDGFEVVLLAPEDTVHRDRDRLLTASSLTTPQMLQGWRSPEDFCIAMQTGLADGGDDKPRLLACVSNIRGENAVHAADDGVAQVVTVTNGAMLAESTVENPFVLRPWSTYSEIEQPARPFILRVKGGGNDKIQVNLFECSTEAWRAAAVRSIVEYLEGTLDVPVIG